MRAHESAPGMGGTAVMDDDRPDRNPCTSASATCGCRSVGDALRWWSLVVEAADLGDGDMRALLPLVVRHADLVSEAITADTVAFTVEGNSEMDYENAVNNITANSPNTSTFTNITPATPSGAQT